MIEVTVQQTYNPTSTTHTHIHTHVHIHTHTWYQNTYQQSRNSALASKLDNTNTVCNALKVTQI